MKGFTVVASWLVIAVPVAQADCGTTDKTLFSCITKNGKQIEVCNFGKTIRYSFGKPKEKAEITVSVSRDTVAGEEGFGSGRYITHTVDIRNENAIYSVGWGSDRLTDSEDGWVEVVINDTSKVISCASEPFIGNFEGIEFKAPVIGE